MSKKLFQDDGKCLVCGNSTSGAQHCLSYMKPVHNILGISDGAEEYSSNILCYNKLKIANEREQADHGVKLDAEKMVKATAKIFLV